MNIFWRRLMNYWAITFSFRSIWRIYVCAGSVARHCRVHSRRYAAVDLRMLRELVAYREFAASGGRFGRRGLRSNRVWHFRRQ